MPVTTLRPNANGYLVEWDPVGGAIAVNWKEVDDVIIDSGTWNQSTGTTAETDAYDLPASGLTGKTINSVTVYYAIHRARTGFAASSPVFKCGVRVGGTDYLEPTGNTPPDDVPAVWVSYSYAWALSPDTSANWTVAEIDALQLLAYNTATEGAQDGTWITQIYADVDWSEPAVGSDIAVVTGPILVRLHNARQLVIGAIDTPVTVSTAAELEVVDGRNLVCYHEMAQTTSGGYVTLKLRPYCRVASLRDGVAATIAAAPTGLSRTSNVVTVTTTAAHGFASGSNVVIQDATAGFNGEFLITSVPLTTTFTFYLTGDDGTGGGGTAREIIQPPHGGLTFTGGINLPASAQSSSYYATFYDVRGYCLVTCNVTDGKHRVWAWLVHS